MPFARGGKPVGTVWVLWHQEGRTFTDDDVRVVQTLTTFATAILDVALRPARKPRAK